MYYYYFKTFFFKISRNPQMNNFDIRQNLDGHREGQGFEGKTSLQSRERNAGFVIRVKIRTNDFFNKSCILVK